MTYPAVLSEDATLDLLLAGRSIARYGDGEFRLMIGGERPGQPYDATLARRLREVLQDSGECLVGIPNLVGPKLPPTKADFWRKYTELWLTKHFAKRQYVSSFITRPDSAPWINRLDYWTKVRQLWAGMDVTLVRGTGAKSLLAERMPEARSVREVVGPRIGAWSERQRLMDQVGTPDHPVILCLGLSATVMAADLCAKGVQALDLGHIGMFLKAVREDGKWHPKGTA